ncbi:MAG: hypothetical protein JNK15_13380 [Planctomycetes bacterium]|nr:hypothetical protein [Planctomycetota bacterium]
MTVSHALFSRLRQQAADAVLVAAHRGDSRHHPENTLAAFAAAAAVGVAVQEFDVQRSRDGVLVCMHDAGLDRTTDSARQLGPGALVAQTTWNELQRLDAGAWFSGAHAGERIPTMAQALAVILPGGIPLIEHKAGTAADFVAELDRLGVHERCILQSFDWSFVQAAHRLNPGIALALLGPTATHAALDDDAIRAALAAGAGMLHWQANDLTRSAVAACHSANLLVCSYTTDDELGWVGGAGIGIDIMCTNDPDAMRRLSTNGGLRR